MNKIGRAVFVLALIGITIPALSKENIKSAFLFIHKKQIFHLFAFAKVERRIRWSLE